LPVRRRTRAGARRPSAPRARAARQGAFAPSVVKALLHPLKRRSSHQTRGASVSYDGSGRGVLGAVDAELDGGEVGAEEGAVVASVGPASVVVAGGAGAGHVDDAGVDEAGDHVE